MSARFLQRADTLKVLKECQVKRVRVGGSSIEEFHHLRLTIAVHAQAWPTRAVRVIATSPPGGSVDLLARLAALDEDLNAGARIAAARARLG